MDNEHASQRETSGGNDQATHGEDVVSEKERIILQLEEL